MYLLVLYNGNCVHEIFFYASLCQHRTNARFIQYGCSMNSNQKQSYPPKVHGPHLAAWHGTGHKDGKRAHAP